MKALDFVAFRRGRLQQVALAAFFVCWHVPADSAASDSYSDAALRTEMIAIFGQMPPPEQFDVGKVDLGNRLFHDPRLSANDQISCASCHILEQGGDDGLKFSIGVSGEKSVRNSPSVFNLNGHVAYFWDGRAQSLETQIDGPIHHPDEMGTDWPSIIEKLSGDNALYKEFRRLYGGMDERSIKNAIVIFEKSLRTDDSAFDRYLRGDDVALSDTAKKGAQHFLNFGCSSCHQGYLVGGNLFQKFGVYRAENDESFQHLFKVPSLRNVEHTAPYFHDGREATLQGAVRTMADAQLGRPLSEIETKNLVAFLKSLSGEQFSDMAGQDVGEETP